MTNQGGTYLKDGMCEFELNGQGRSPGSLLPDTNMQKLSSSLGEGTASIVFCGLCAEQIQQTG